MRRILILLVVLLGGAATLWHFESQRREAMERDGRTGLVQDARRGPDEDSSLTSRGEASDEPDGAQDGQPGGGADGIGSVGNSDAVEAQPGADSGTDPDRKELGKFSAKKGEKAIFSGPGTINLSPREPGQPRLLGTYSDQVPRDNVGLSYDYIDLQVDSIEVPESEEGESSGATMTTAEAEARLRSSITAKRAFIEVENPGFGTSIFQDQLVAELTDVAAEFKSGTSFAGLTIDAEKLTMDFGLEQLRSMDDGVVKFRSKNMKGSGVGLDARLRDGSITLSDGADFRWTLAGERTLELATPEGGPLSITDLTASKWGTEAAADALADRGPRLLKVVADDGVHAEFSEGSAQSTDANQTSRVAVPLIIDAASIELELSVSAVEHEPEILSAQASGAVKIRHGRDIYRGESARVIFVEGQPHRIVIEQSPSLTYTLAQPDGQEVPLRMTGQGPITGYLQGGTEENPEMRFAFQGPGRVETLGRGGVVTFENEARGNGVRDRSQATVLLAGDVKVETPEGTLRSDALIALYRAGQDLRVATDGETLIVGRNPETNEEYHVRAEGGLTAHLVDEAWFVDRAENVYAEAYGKEPHRVRAGLITDVDVAARTLKAADDISYESLWGRAVAGRALVRTTDRVELEGSREVPVKLDLVEESSGLLSEDADPGTVRTGWIHAERLSFDATEVLASGSVAAQVETFDGVWGFDADELSVRREVTGESFLLDGGAAEPAVGSFSSGKMEDVYLEARFVREARYDTSVGNAVVAADHVEVQAGLTEEDARSGENASIDADRSAILKAAGRVAIDMESYGPEFDERGAPTVQQTVRLAGEAAELERFPYDGKPDSKLPFRLVASKVTECRMAGLGQVLELVAQEVIIEGALGALDVTRADGELDLIGSSVEASGSVDMRFKPGADQPEMTGECGLLVLKDGVSGRMEPERRFLVKLSGVAPGTGLKYTIQAKLVTFTREELIADALDSERVKIELESPVKVSSLGLVVDEVRTRRLVATPGLIQLDGDSVMTGTSGTGQPLTLEVQDLTLNPRDLEFVEESKNTIGPFDPVPGPQQDESEEDESEGQTQSGPLKLVFGDQFQVAGVVRGVDGDSGSIILDDASAELFQQGISLDADWLALNQKRYTLDAGRGAVRGGGNTPWTLAFASIETVEFEDELMITITAPRVTYGLDSARADYLALWVDRARWEALAGRSLGDVEGQEEIEGPVLNQKPNFLAEILFELQQREYGGYVRALYMEGGVEVVRGDRRAARGSKLYIDLPKAIAWLEDAELVYPLMSKGEEVPLRVRTKRLGTDEAGRLTAKNATLTTCDHDVPHFVVRTRKFALEPRDDGRWRFAARGNRLKFEGGPSLPLPSIGNLVLDEEFGIDGFENEAGEVTPLRDIGVARTARFGTVLGAAFRFDIGDIGSWVAERIGMDSTKLRGKWETEAQWLSGRGPLVGLGLQLREREPGDDPDEDFRLDSFVGGILDDGRDRGAVRVDEADREDLRITGYVRARYPIVRGEWFDFAGASQTDAGVQSEFYEGDFLRFEQRDTFVRWRKSYGADYLAAGVQKRVNSFRSQKEELPSFAAYRGEREIGTFTGVPVLWGGSFDAGYFRRREGDVGQDLFSDLPGGAAFGLGDQETGRADLRQRLSLPVQTSFAAIRATPFAEVLGSAWTNALDDGDDPRRGAIRTGLELSTTLHKVTDNGYLNALAPRFSYSTDLASDRTGGDLIPLDRTEAPIDGTRYEAGLRSLWQRPGTFENLDVDLKAVFFENRDDGVPDSSELATLAQYITRYGDGEGQIGVRHDARYDLEDTETTYSRSAFAIRPNDAFLVEFRYSQARDILEEELYETGGILGRWRLDPKWELESRYVHDLKNDRQLLTELTVRRYAHDFVFDMTFQDRAGEGGVNLSFNLAPLLGWAVNRIGMLDR